MSLPGGKKHNHGYNPSQLINHGNQHQHDNGMNCNHVASSALPSTVAAGVPPYSAAVGSTAAQAVNIRTNYATTGHVNQSTVPVTIPPPQVPTPSNTPPVPPDPKLHFINPQNTMVRESVIRNNYYSSTQMTPPAQPMFRQPHVSSVYRSANPYINANVFGQSASSQILVPQLRFQQVPSFYVYQEPRQNNFTQQHQNFTTVPATAAPYSYTRPSFLMNNIIPQNAIVQQPMIASQGTHQVVAVNSSQQQQCPFPNTTSNSQPVRVTIQDPNTCKFVTAQQLANEDKDKAKEKGTPSNALSDSAQEFVTQVSKRALEPSSVSDKSVRLSSLPSSSSSSSNSSRNCSNNVSNNNVVSGSSEQQHSLLKTSEQWTNDSSCSVSSVSNEFSDGELIIHPSANGRIPFNNADAILPLAISDISPNTAHSSSQEANATNSSMVYQLNNHTNNNANQATNSSDIGNQITSHQHNQSAAPPPSDNQKSSLPRTTSLHNAAAAPADSANVDSNEESSSSSSSSSTARTLSVTGKSNATVIAEKEPPPSPSTSSFAKSNDVKQQYTNVTTTTTTTTTSQTDNSIVSIAQHTTNVTTDTENEPLAKASLPSLKQPPVVTAAVAVAPSQPSLPSTQPQQQQATTKASLDSTSSSSLLSASSKSSEIDYHVNKPASTSSSNNRSQNQSSQHPLTNQAHEKCIVVHQHQPNLPKAFSSKSQQQSDKNQTTAVNQSKEDKQQPVNVTTATGKGKKQFNASKDEVNSSDHHIPAKNKSSHSYQRTGTNVSDSSKTSNISHSKQTNGETNIETSTVNERSKAKKKKKKDLNQKGLEKEGSDMDAISEKSQMEKEKHSGLNEKSQYTSNTRVSSNNQISKGISSQKAAYKGKNDENAHKNEKSMAVKNDYVKSSADASKADYNKIDKSNTAAANAKNLSSSGSKKLSASDHKKSSNANSGAQTKNVNVTEKKVTTEQHKSTVNDEDGKQPVNAAVLREKQNNSLNTAPVLREKIPPNSSSTILREKQQTAQTEKLKPETRSVSPNKFERRVYSLEELKSLKDVPLSNNKIDIPSSLQHIGKEAPPFYGGRSHSQSNYGNTNMFAPDFVNVGNRFNNVPMRRSQQGPGKRDKPPPIHVTLSLGDDVQLHQSEQAWKPGRFTGNNNTSKEVDDEEKKTQELYKAVTGILNKLTPQKFDKLVNKIKSLPIDSLNRMQGVIELIFQKAIDEPGFCKTYAQMCAAFQKSNVEFVDPQNPTGKKLNFRVILITKCQNLFEKNQADELKVVEREREINACTDPEKKKELQLLFEDEERRVRRRSVGNCRFIGELFKLCMLTSKIMCRCIEQLLCKIDEESLECLCKLLTTIGKQLEDNKTELDGYFKTMQDLTEKKSSKISSRIRFMLLDVIDLRKGDWIPRRDENLPKKIDQLDEEFEQKEYNERMNSLIPLQKKPQQQEDRYKDRDNRKGNRIGGSKSIDEGGWQTPKPTNYTKGSYTVDAKKFQHISEAAATTELFGSAHNFSKWSSGSSGLKSRSDGRSYGSTSMYNMGMDNKLSSMPNTSTRNMHNRPTHSPSMERNLYSSSIDEPEKQTRNNIVPQSAGTPLPSRESSTIRPVSSSHSLPPSSASNLSSKSQNLSTDELRRKVKYTLDELLSHGSFEESLSSIREWFHPSYADKFPSILFDHTLEKSPQHRDKLGHLLSQMISKNIISPQNVVKAIQEYVSIWSDIVIDCPNFSLYLAEILGPLLVSDSLTFEHIRQGFCESIYHTPYCGELLANILIRLKQTQTTQSIQKRWNKCNLKLSDFIQPETVNEFVKKYSLQYLVNGSNASNGSVTEDTVHKRVCELQSIIKESAASNKPDRILSFIQNTVKDHETKIAFIHTLPSIFEIAHAKGLGWKDYYDAYNNNIQFLIDNHDELYEVECLKAVHKIIHKLEYPQGWLLGIFERLYDNSIISVEGFERWKEIPGMDKGVAMTQLHAFYLYINEVK